MKSDRLLMMSVILVAIGLGGILATARFGGITTFGDWPPYGSGMMWMMGRGLMKEMMQEMISGRLPPGIKPESLPEPASPGARLLAQYCTQCHNLPSPAMHAAEEWPVIEARMFSRMQMMAGMKGMMGGMMRRRMMDLEAPLKQEEEAILAYLQQYALKPASLEALGPPDAPGLVLFRKTCSQCHALPDPKQHITSQWPAVVERMRSNMQTMGKRVITEGEKEQIAAYLGQHAR